MLITTVLGFALSLAPCQYEDGSSQHAACVWDGHHRGNHVGSSYIEWRGHITPISHRLAHQLTH